MAETKEFTAMGWLNSLSPRDQSVVKSKYGEINRAAKEAVAT